MGEILEAYQRKHAPRLANREMADLFIERLIAELGHMRPSALGLEQLESYEARRRAGKVTRHKAGDGTIRRELGGVLVPALNWAVEHRMLRRDQVPSVPLPPPPPPRDRWLRREEIARLLEVARTTRRDGRLSRVERFVWLALLILSRRKAIEELRWEQVDLEAGVIDLNAAGRVQTKKRRPRVPIPASLGLVLRKAQEERREGSVFVLDHPGSVRMALKRCCIAAGFPEVTAHTLRHTGATWMAKEGVDMWEIAGMLGNSIAMVEKVYAHHHPSFLKKAASALDRMVS